MDNLMETNMQIKNEPLEIMDDANLWLLHQLQGENMQSECDKIHSAYDEQHEQKHSYTSPTISESIYPENDNLLFSKYFKVDAQLNQTLFQQRRRGVVAECVTCRKKIRGSLQVTSNFLRHLKKTHPNKFIQYNLEKSETSRKPRERDDISKKPKDDQLMYYVSKFFISNVMTLSIVDSQSFKELVTYAGGVIKETSIPTKQSMMIYIDKMYEEMNATLRGQLAIQRWVCTTADIWKVKHQSFLGYTCHWLELDGNGHFKRKSVYLACKRFMGSHTYEKIRDMIWEIHKKFDLLSTKIVATVTDNGSNFVKVFKEFGVVSDSMLENTESRDSCEEDDDADNEVKEFCNEILDAMPAQHFKCVSHILKLLTTQDLIGILKKKPELYSRHLNVMQKCSNLWNKVNRTETFETIISTFGIHLKYPVVTRWNSLYESVEQILDNKEKLPELCTCLSIPIISAHDIEYLSEYHKIVSPIWDALNFLQVEKTTFYGYFLPTLATLRNKLNKMETLSQLNILCELPTEMENALMERFKPFYNLSPVAHDAIVAAVLCPSMKFEWVKALNPPFRETQQLQCSNVVIEAIKNTNYDVAPNIEATEQLEGQEKTSLSFFDFNIEDSLPSTSKHQSKGNTTAMREYSCYLADPGTSLKVLNKYPFLKEVFFKYNTPLTTSTYVERLFSVAGQVNSPKRGRLTDDNFEKMVLLKAYKSDF